MGERVQPLGSRGQHLFRGCLGKRKISVRLRLHLRHSAETLRGNVVYVYYDHYDKDEGYLEVLDPEREQMTADEIPEDFSSVRVVELWDDDVVYSPTAIMKLENEGYILPKSLAVLIILNIIFFQILALVTALIIKPIRKAVIFTKKKVTGIDTPVREDVLELPEAKKQLSV